MAKTIAQSITTSELIDLFKILSEQRTSVPDHLLNDWISLYEKLLFALIERVTQESISNTSCS